MKTTIKQYLKRLKQSNGAFTHTGHYISKAELTHTFIPALLLGIMQMQSVFLGIMGLVTSGSKLTGHLGDFKKNMAYGITAYPIGRTIIEIWQVIA